MTDIRKVRYSEILDAPNAEDLLAEYAEECSIPELGKPTPQRDLYELLESSGGFQAFGVYSDKTLVGFAVVLIYVLPHYGKKIAATESIFISRVKRNNGIGGNLLKTIEGYAKDNFCEAFLYSAPDGSMFDRVLSARYRHTNNVYLRSVA